MQDREAIRLSELLGGVLLFFDRFTFRLTPEALPDHQLNAVMARPGVEKLFVLVHWGEISIRR